MVLAFDPRAAGTALEVTPVPPKTVAEGVRQPPVTRMSGAGWNTSVNRSNPDRVVTAGVVKQRDRDVPGGGLSRSSPRSSTGPAKASQTRIAGLPDTLGGEFLAGLGRRVATTPGEIELAKTNDYSYLQPEAWAVMAYKSKHRLVVYFHGRMFRQYRAVFGRLRAAGAKEWAGDRRTPEGAYRIIGKRYHPRWHRFLALDYPNAADRRHYDDLRRAGLIPVVHGHPLGIGSGIGIHGTDSPALNRASVDWTTGCISVDNDAVAELYEILPTGTTVVILP